jgi:hypothetical protein
MECARTGCTEPATLGIKTDDRGVRGIATTVYYDPANAPKGAEANCSPHGVALLTSLIDTLGGY